MDIQNIKLDSTLPSVLNNAATQWPDEVAVQDGDLSLSFTQLQTKAMDAAAAMIAQGLKAGDRFAIWAPNIHEWIWVALGGMMAGAVLVPLNTRYRGLEAGDILRRSKARLLFTTSGFLETDYPALLKDEALPDLEQTILLRGESSHNTSIDSFMATLTSSDKSEVNKRIEKLTPSSPCDIMYTSGTTGAPKGVVSCHGQTVAIFQTWSDTVGLNCNDRYLIVNPFFHSFGYKAGWLSCLIQGATALPMAVYNPQQTLRIIEQQQISILPGAPTIFQTLLADESLRGTDTSSLRCSVTGAASVPEQLVHDMKNTLGFDEVFTAYGLTECPVVSITRKGDALSTIANTAGRAIDGTEIKVTDEQGNQVALGDVGDIKVRGYNVMQGYFNNLEASNDAIDKDGWLDTGDVGWKDENGNIKITDRAKDMYICGGFNCYPAEIENLLLRHPDINDVAILGMPEERLGEVGQAYLVSNRDDLSHQELKDWSREHMANFKVPRQFLQVDELPRNASGKVQKFKLAEAHNSRLL